MTAKAWQITEESGEVVDCELIEEGHDEMRAVDVQIDEGQPSYDAAANSKRVVTPEELTNLNIAKSGIKLLLHHIIEIEDGAKPTFTLQQIGQALVGTPAPHPNWYEKVLKCEYQDKLLRNSFRSISLAIEALDMDLYATRVKNAREYLEDAYNELKEDYGFEEDR